jgi:Flp pilus assembly protein TadD
MYDRPRTGSRLHAAWGLLLLISAASLRAAEGNATPVSGDSAEGTSASLLNDIGPVLAHAYPGIDTLALLGRIGERLKWGEKDERLIEAEGILHLDRREFAQAKACFGQLTAPKPPAMLLMAEALDAGGEKYEAAAWRLRAARALPPADPASIAMYQAYLAVRPGEEQAEVELAGRLETQMRFGEAMDLYWKHRDRLAHDTAAVARAADLLAVHGRLSDAAALLAQAREEDPTNRVLGARLANVREAMGDKTAAAAVWSEIWARDPADRTALDSALSLLEASGPAGEVAFRGLVAKALQRDSGSADLHFRMAGISLSTGDRKGAYAHLDRALRASPANPVYLARLPEAIEGDSLIQVHAALLEESFGKNPASPRLALLAARAYSLAGDRPNACRAWTRLAEADPKSLDGRRDAFLDLAACGDPASLGLAMLIGSKQLAAGFDRETGRSMILLALKSQNYPMAAGYAARLAAESPEDAKTSLDAARALLAAGREAEARRVLTALADHAHVPEAALILGRFHWAAHAWDSAIPRLQAARDSFPEAGPMLGECFAQTKDYPASAAAYETHFARTGNKESLRAAARMRKLAGDAPKEGEDLQALEDSAWAGESERLRLGLIKAATGKSRAAMALYEDLFRGRTALPDGEGGEKAGWSEAALQYGMQMARDGQLDKAIRVLNLGLKSAAAGTPGLTESWLRLGECLAEKKQWREAYAAYASALAIDSASDEAAVEMLSAAKRFDGKPELAAAYRAVYRVDSLNPEANAAMGAVRQAAHEYREAARHYRRVAEAHPSDPSAWENLGNALALVPDLKAASGPLQTAIDLGAQSDEVYINRARAYRAEGEKKMAASIVQFLLGRNPRDYLAVLWSAKFAEEDGYADVASDLFRKTAKLQAPRSSWPELSQARLSPPRETKTAARAD